MNKTIFAIIKLIKEYQLLSKSEFFTVSALLFAVILLDFVTLNFVRTTFVELKSANGTSLYGVACLLIVIFLKAGLSIFNYYHITRISHNMLANVRKILFKKFFDLNEKRGFKGGWLIELLQRHSGVFSIHFFQSCMRALVDIIVILSLMAYTFYLYPIVFLPLTISIILPIFMWIALTRKKLVELAETSNQANLGVTNVATNLLGSIDEVKVNGLPQLAIDYIAQSGRSLTKAQAFTAALMNTPKHLWEVCLIVFGLLFMLVLHGNFYSSNELGLVSVTLGAIMIRVIPLLNSFTVNVNHIRHSKPSIEIILDMISTHRKEVVLTEKLVNSDIRPDIYRDKGPLAIVQVSKGNILDVNGSVFQVKDRAKEFVLVKGKSGRGKTSLIRGLVGLKSMEILHPKLKNLNQNILVSKVRWSAQEGVLFDTTISLNVKLYDEVENILDPMRRIGLLDTDPEMFDREINASNNEISTGQKRRLGILRAVESKADWVILDEPEAGMDNDTIQKLHSYVSQYIDHQNFIVISHSSIFDRLATTKIELT